jgi:hypothetical protein
MKEIAPGVWSWSARHPGIGAEVHSCFLAAEGLLIDPMEPPGGVDRIGEIAPPAAILLTNRHHYRASGRFREAYGVPVRCHRAGLHEFTKGEVVEPFEFGDRFAGGALAVPIGALCPEETAFAVDREGGIVALGDSVVRWEPRGPLGFVPDVHMGEEPDAVKRGLAESLRRLLERPCTTLVLAHGEPITPGGREALLGLLEGKGGT